MESINIMKKDHGKQKTDVKPNLRKPKKSGKQICF